MPGPTDSPIKAARARADAELKKAFAVLDPNDFGSSAPAFHAFADSVKLLFNEEAPELLHTSTDFAAFERDVRRLREQIMDEYTKAPPRRKMRKRQRRRIEHPMDLDQRLSVMSTDKWDLFAPTRLLPNKKHAVREELKRVLGQQLPYWLREAREFERHRAPSSISRKLAPEAEFTTPDETLAQSTMPNSGDKQLGSRKFRTPALEPTDRPAVRTWFRSGDAILSLRKSNGTMFEGLEAHLSPDAILVTDVPYPIETGDMLIRTSDDGLRVGFIVDDPGYGEALGRIPAHFKVKARLAAPIDSLESSDFWRSRRTDFEELSSRQRDSLGLDREHPKWLKGYCSRVDEEGGVGAYCSVDGGLDSEQRSKFEEIATRAAIALGSPPSANPVGFWLCCLCLDLLQDSPNGAIRELLQSVAGGGFIVDLLGSSAAYCSRLAAMADRKTNDHQNDGINPKGDTQIPDPTGVAGTRRWSVVTGIEKEGEQKLVRERFELLVREVLAELGFRFLASSEAVDLWLDFLLKESANSRASGIQDLGSASKHQIAELKVIARESEHIALCSKLEQLETRCEFPKGLHALLRGDFCMLPPDIRGAAAANRPSTHGPEAAVYPNYPPDESDDWVRVPRADWRQEAAASQKPPAFLRPVAAARLAAIAALRKDAAEAVQNAKPQTPHELEQCLWSAFTEYAAHLFDGMAESKLKAIATAGGRSKAYASWLKSKCLPAVIDDVCKPILGQFPITVRYLAEMIPDVNSPGELARMRRALWKMSAEEVIPALFTDSLEKRLRITLQEERIPRWEAEAMQLGNSAPSESIARSLHAGCPAQKGDPKPLTKADGTFYVSVDFPTAERYADITARRRQQLISKGILVVVGKGKHRRITVDSLMAYCPNAEHAK